MLRGVSWTSTRSFLSSSALPVVIAIVALTGIAVGRVGDGTGAQWDAAASSSDRSSLPVRAPDREGPGREGLAATRARAETLWIFDADFEDLLGDNAGWTTEDLSGTPAKMNYWHKDTIRINGFTHLGDSTWWCGKYDNCWRQPRGYGNDWVCNLVRVFPEVYAHTGPGDVLTLVYDQRYAIEKDYDYGYTDISTDGGESWNTVAFVDNPGFAGTPGLSQNWDSMFVGGPGHQVLDISEYAGQEVVIRFRFESDCCYSAQDQYDNATHSCLDGAWQLDNIALYDCYPPEGEPFYLFDCESPGDGGWAHDDIPGENQTGVVFERGLYGTDFWTNRPASCGEQSGWMYAAVDPATSRMVDHEYTWLMSPPIDISGAGRLVGQWDAWVDFPRLSDDIYNLYVCTADAEECAVRPHLFVDESRGWWYGDPQWGTWTDDWDRLAGDDWLAVMWAVQSGTEPPSQVDHMGGLYLNRQRVGVVTGEDETGWSYGVLPTHYEYWPPWPWTDGRFSDWFYEQLEMALLDSAFVEISDSDGVASAFVLASDDSGATWNAYPMRFDYQGIWVVTPPVNQMTRCGEIRYYFEATDSLGNTSTYPSGAPDECFEFSILPITSTTEDPGILIVDKHNALTPGEDRAFGHSSDYSYREALDILGYAYDVFDVECPAFYGLRSRGPDTLGMKYYDTQIWIASDSREPTLGPLDQANLVSWLSEASEGRERNLLLSGNNIAHDLTVGDAETLGFYSHWLASEYVSDGIGDVSVDSLPLLEDCAAGFDFMTHDDRRCILRGGCPRLGYFDVIQPSRAVEGVETALEYVRSDMMRLPAGVAFTDTTGYQTVTLGFGVEFMSHALLPDGHYSPGISDRVDLMRNIMEYFEETPTEPPTGVEGEAAFVNHLGHARPNPFNPKTTVSYDLAEAGHVTLTVYDVTGRVVRTLVDAHADAGPHSVVWDGTGETGERAASGVYLVRMAIDGVPAENAGRKMVLLK